MQFDPALAGVARAQHGVIERQQALRHLDSGGISRRVRAGQLEVVHPRVYRVAGAPVTWEQRLVAAQLAAGPGAAISHRSAAQLWGMADGLGDVVELTVPASRAPRLRGVIVHRSGDLRADHLAHRRNIVVTHPMRTFVDLGAVCPRAVVADALERALVARLFTIAAAEAIVFDLSEHGRDGVGVARGVLDDRALRAARPDGLLEPRMARLLVRHGLPIAEYQHVIRHDGGAFVARVDFAYPHLRVAIEVDGFAVHGTPAAMAADFVRQNALHALGWIVLRFTWHQVVRQPAAVAAAIADVLCARTSA